MSEPRSNPPSSAVAVALGLACTGLGQMYCGRMRRGLAFLGASLLLSPALVATVLFPPSHAALLVLLGVIGAAAVLLAVSVIDAGLLARRLRRQGVTGTSIGAPMGFLFAAVGLAAPVGMALVVRATTFEAFRIAAGSMEPGLEDGDRCLVDKRPLQHGLPVRGDIVIYRLPAGHGRAYVKRVVAVEGDSVEVREGEVVVNGVPLPHDASGAPEAGLVRESLGGSAYWVRPGGPTGAPHVVPRDHVYVLGDNRGDSSDSRDQGPVGRDALVGVVRHVYWPLSRLRTLHR